MWRVLCISGGVLDSRSRGRMFESRRGTTKLSVTIQMKGERQFRSFYEFVTALAHVF